MPWVPEGPSVIAQHKVLGKEVFFSGVLEGHLNDHLMRWDILKLRINKSPRLPARFRSPLQAKVSIIKNVLNAEPCVFMDARE